MSQLLPRGSTLLPSGSTLQVVAPGVVESLWIKEGPPGGKGDTGDTGPANSLSIGTVDSGADADATITGTAPAQTLNLTLPKGDDGDAATITVGTVTTVAADEDATVTNVGTSAAAVFDFEIPQGEDGADGEGSGDMLAATYDPQSIADDAFDRANHTGTQALSTITGVTATASEVNALDGITASTTELNYTDGVTSGIQTQLNGKASTTGGGREATAALSATTGAATGDCSAASWFYVTPSGDITSLTFSNLPTSGTGCTIILEVVQGGTTRTVAMPSGTVHWLTDQPTHAANKRTFYTFSTRDAGSNWIVSAAVEK